MSDSDEFDKEAEREKLRRKFAEDEKKREHTQRMSELLLKGATMTNRHCEECGDPIFRHDGQEFCPTCNRPAEQATAESSGGAEARGADAADARRRPGGAPDHGTEGAERGSPPERTVEVTHPEAADAIPSTTPPTSTPAEAEAGAPARDDGERVNRGRVPGHEADETAASATGAVDDARASLERTLAKFARAAEETDDPRRAREHLRAAREAAETLDALN